MLKHALDRGWGAFLVALTALACSAGTSTSPAAPVGGSGAGGASAGDKPGAGAALVGAPDPANPPVKITIAYVSPQTGVAPLWIAKEAGYFANYGLEVEVSYVPSSARAVPALMAGELQLAQAGAETIVQSNLAGSDLAIVMGMVSRLPHGFVARPEITSPQQLRGTRWGISRRATSTEVISRVALKAWGLDPDQDVAFVETGGGSIFPSLEAGAVDAAIMSEPDWLVARKRGYSVLGRASELNMIYQHHAVAARGSYLHDQPETVRRAIAAWTQGMARFFGDKEYALKVMRQYTKSEEEDILEQTYDGFARTYLERIPYPSREGIQTILDISALLNPSAADARPEQFMDSRFVEELDKSGYLRSIGLRQ